MISVVIPTLNEAKHIQGLLAALLTDAPTDLVEIIVADGGSTDGTQTLVTAAAAADPRVRLLDNPDRLQAAGVNRAAAAAHSAADILVRIDAHAGYPPRFVARVAEALRAAQADSVVVRLHTVGVSCFQKAVAAVSNSKLGTGGAAHRIGGESRWIDHGHHAGFRLSRYRELGGYDEGFAANEDAEFDQRLLRAGGRIWFAADLEIDYYPRTSVGRLARQYFRYGRGRAQNVAKNGGRLKLRQVIPPVLVLGIAASLLGAVFSPWLLIAPAAYFAAVATAGLAFAITRRDACLLTAALALPAMHMGWGYGFLLQAVRGRSHRSGDRLGRPTSLSTS